MGSNSLQSDNESADTAWRKTHFANLVRYVPSGTYFARIRVRGKLIRKSLKTDVLSVAKLRLADFVKDHREGAEVAKTASKGRMTIGECVAVFRKESDEDHRLKPGTKEYRREVIHAIVKSWPNLEAKSARAVTGAECDDWARRFAADYSATRFNAAIGILRGIFSIAIKAGAIYKNPTASLKRAKVKAKRLRLPTPEQFNRSILEIERGGGRDSKNCADLVRFLAFGGFRISEAATVTWHDCDLAKEIIRVKGDPEHGTKNGMERNVPIIPDMRQLLGKLRAERSTEDGEATVMKIRECQKAMNRAAREVKMERITHHDLRHLFATRCIESGVDVPTVSRWLGHKDGGALAMKLYGHLRDHHSVAMAQKVSFSSKPAEPEKPESKTEGAKPS
jgi:integrase